MGIFRVLTFALTFVVPSVPVSTPFLSVSDPERGPEATLSVPEVRTSSATLPLSDSPGA